MKQKRVIDFKGATYLFCLLLTINIHAADDKLEVIPAVCEAEANLKCEIRVKWEVDTGTNACVHIVRESDGASYITNSPLCLQKGLIPILISPGEAYQITLTKNGESRTTISADIERTLALAVEKKSELSKTISGGPVSETVTSFIRDDLELNQFVAATWDSRILFGIKKFTLSPNITAHVYRPEAIDEISHNPFTGNTISSEYRFEPPSNSTYEQLGATLYQHMTVYPLNTGEKSNPYRSDANGSYNKSGAFQTYQVGAILPTKQYEDNNSPVSPIPTNKTFFVRVKLQVVIKNPETNSAEIESITVKEQAVPLKYTVDDTSDDTSDDTPKHIFGHEPSVSLDGRLLIFSGTETQDDNREIGGRIHYTFLKNDDSGDSTKWTKPKNIAHMHWKQGPGNNNEYEVQPLHSSADRLNFSQVYPFAAQPITNYTGEDIFGSTEEKAIIRGAYPWISLDGSEIIFSSIAGFHGADRHGVTVVGKRTKGILRRIDGQMDPVRGNVFNHVSTYLKNGNPKFNMVADTYSRAISDSTNSTHGKDRWWSVINVPLGQFPSSWSPYSSNLKKSLPLNTFEESYGFLMYGNRYAEVTFPNLREDLLIYYPMNEPYAYNHPLLKRCSDPESTIDSSSKCKKGSTYYKLTETADYSGYSHTGKFSPLDSSDLSNNGVYYYFDGEIEQSLKDDWTQWMKYPGTGDLSDTEQLFNDVTVYEDTATYNSIGPLDMPSHPIGDISSGRHGQSLYFKRKGLLTAALESEAIQKIQKSNSLSVGFWIKPHYNTANGQRNKIFNISNKLILDFIDGNLSVRLKKSSSSGYYEALQETIDQMDQSSWTHIALTYNTGILKLYLNGTLVEETTEPVSDKVEFDSDSTNTLKIGMGLGGANGKIYQIDEFYLYAVELPLSEIQTLAFQKKVESPATLPNNSGAKISFGKRLFKSQHISNGGSKSCASCHQSALNFEDSKEISEGINGLTGSRKTPSIVDSNQLSKLHWDGKVSSLQTQVLHPLFNPVEMGVESTSHVLAKLNKLGANNDIRIKYNNAYPTESDSESDFNLTNISESLAYYVSSLTSDTDGDQDPIMMRSLDDGQVERGRILFKGKANCVACHNGDKLTDGLFHDIGLANDSDLVERGQAGISGSSSNTVRMKTPSLINVSKRKNFFHNGSRENLNQVLDFYNEGGDQVDPEREIDSKIKPLGLTENEKKAIIKYLEDLDRNVNNIGP